MYRNLRAATKIRKYKSAKIRSHAIQLEGKEYSPFNLESLPLPLRPSTISNLTSETTLAFFSKYSALSNHHPSYFTVEDQKFHTMEQFLAYEKANFSGNEAYIERASCAEDPKEAKALLHLLRDDHTEEWNTIVEDITIKGLKAKFTQNDHLLSFLRSTQGLQLGEASKNERWGIGFELKDKEVLNSDNWNPTGNLLGKCLMKVRRDLCQSADCAPPL